MEREDIIERHQPCAECGRLILGRTPAEAMRWTTRVISLLLATVLATFLIASAVEGPMRGQETMGERVKALETQHDALYRADTRNEAEIAALRDQVTILATNVNRIMGTSAALAGLLVLVKVFDYITGRRHRRRKEE